MFQAGTSPFEQRKREYLLKALTHKQTSLSNKSNNQVKSTLGSGLENRNPQKLDSVSFSKEKSTRINNSKLPEIQLVPGLGLIPGTQKGVTSNISMNAKQRMPTPEKLRKMNNLRTAPVQRSVENRLPHLYLLPRIQTLDFYQSWQSPDLKHLLCEGNEDPHQKLSSKTVPLLLKCPPESIYLAKFTNKQINLSVTCEVSDENTQLTKQQKALNSAEDEGEEEQEAQASDPIKLASSSDQPYETVCRTRFGIRQSHRNQ
jgi:hypothetical protein